MAHLFTISRHDGGQNNYGGHKEAVSMAATFGTIEGAKLSTKGNFTEGETWAAKILVSLGSVQVGDTGKVGSTCVKLLSIDRGTGVATFDVVSGFSNKRDNSAFAMSWAGVKFNNSPVSNNNSDGDNSNNDYQQEGKSNNNSGSNNSDGNNNADGNNDNTNNTEDMDNNTNNTDGNNNSGDNNNNPTIGDLKSKAEKAQQEAKDAREMADYCKGRAEDDNKAAEDAESKAKEAQQKANKAAAAADDDPNNDDLTEKAIEAEADANDSKSKAMRARLKANKSQKQADDKEEEAQQKEEEAKQAQQEYEDAKEEDDNKPIEHKNYQEVLTCVRCGTNVMMIGPSGTGKTTLAQSVAKELGAKYYSQGTVFDLAEIAGYNDANGKYVPSILRNAMDDAVNNPGQLHIMCFEEIDSSDAQAMCKACEAFANKTYTFSDNVRLYAPNLVFMACANTIGRGASVTHVGRAPMDGAIINRFHAVVVDYDPNIDLKCAGGDEELRYLGVELRKMAKEAHLPYEFTPRDFARISQLTAAGLPAAVALRGTFGTWVKSDLEGFLMQIEGNNKWITAAKEALEMLMA